MCLSEASYFPFSGDSGNSALLVQPFPLAPPTGMPVALARSGGVKGGEVREREGERGLRGEGFERGSTPEACSFGGSEGNRSLCPTNIPPLQGGGPAPRDRKQGCMRHKVFDHPVFP